MQKGFGFGKCFEASSQSNYWAGHCWLSYKIHFSLHITIQLRNGSLLLCRIREDDTLMMMLLICGQLMSHWLLELFHLSNLLQMPNDHRMINTELFGNFLYSCKRISFNDGSQLSLATSYGQPLHSSSFSFAKLLEPPLHCTLVSSSWAKRIVDVVSCLCCLLTHFEFK